MISTREVQHIAKLARISLSDAEILQFQKDLGSILEYFDMLREIDPVAPDAVGTASILPLASVTREDTPTVTKPDSNMRLLEMAPETKEGYVKVKSIL